MDWITFAASALVAICSLVGTIYGSRAGVKEANELVNYKLEQLTDKVNKHNNLIERMYSVEEHETIIEEKIKAINHRLKALEELRKE